jgi:hypothetical protein
MSWNSNIRYGINGCLMFDSILSHTKKYHVLKSYFLKIYFNNMFPSFPSPYKWPLFPGLFHQSPVCSSPTCMQRTSPYASFLYLHPENVLCGVPIVKYVFTQFILLCSHYHPHWPKNPPCTRRSNIRGQDKPVSFTMLWLSLTLQMVAAGPR